MIALKTSCIFILVVCQLIFLDKTCQSQFHWGKNYDMEADHLRTLLQKYAANQDLTSLDSIPKVITFCVLTLPSKNNNIPHGYFTFLMKHIFCIQETHAMDRRQENPRGVLEPIRKFLLVNKKYWVGKKYPSNLAKRSEYYPKPRLI